MGRNKMLESYQYHSVIFNRKYIANNIILPCSDYVPLGDKYTLTTLWRFDSENYYFKVY